MVMSTSYVPTARRPRREENPTEPIAVTDWVGLAGYLAGAVADGEVNPARARIELVAAVVRANEGRSLRRAAVDAAMTLGPDDEVTLLLSRAVEDMDAIDV
jgi:hypothetical protein